MKDMRVIKALIEVLKRKTKAKNLLDLAMRISEYYFATYFDTTYIDQELLKKMRGTLDS